MPTRDSQFDAVVFDIHRNSTHDGPGIRTTVFLKGCPLRCRWCHNPESRRFQPEVWWFGQNCIACHRCIQACERKALTFGDGAIRIDRSRCVGCLACARACPARAQQPLGARAALLELLAEVASDRPWYEATGGGVTLSGGEPCSQPEFAQAFLSQCRQQGLHTALDTCGQAPTALFSKILNHVDLLLFDLKHPQEEAHRNLTGKGLTLILANLEEAVRRSRERSMRLWVRTPLIPGAAADPAILSAIGNYLREHFDGAIERWELCAFNPSCGAKYARLGMEWPYAGIGLLTDADASSLLKVAKESCGRSEIVKLQGLRRGPNTLHVKPAKEFAPCEDFRSGCCV